MYDVELLELDDEDEDELLELELLDEWPFGQVWAAVATATPLPPPYCADDELLLDVVTAPFLPCVPLFPCVPPFPFAPTLGTNTRAQISATNAIASRFIDTLPRCLTVFPLSRRRSGRKLAFLPIRHA